mmetsp:Transcript_41441/g.125212  ORF Transcript_41441/g.125212 Transcript_41441/m.125212 type:complete len:160 (-) Transcript_41441:128-607(-)
MLIKGPENSLYAGGVFKLDITLPDKFPREPPTVRFATEVWHPSISPVDGSVHLRELMAKPWTEMMTIEKLVLLLEPLLKDPKTHSTMGDIANYEAANQMKDDWEGFEMQAKFMTEAFAKQEVFQQVDQEVEHGKKDLFDILDGQPPRKVLNPSDVWNIH